MTRSFRGASAGFAALLLTGLLVSACGDDDDDDGGSGNGGGTQVDPDPLNLEIQSVAMPATGPATVTFRLTNQAGQPIDLMTELTNQNNSTNAAPLFPRSSPRFTLAMLDANGDYKSYYESTRQIPTTWTTPPNFPLPADATPGPATQAGFGTPSASSTTPFPAAQISSGGNGVYTITFNAASTTVTGLDRARTHTVAGYVTRVTQGTGGVSNTDVAFDSFNFVPGGGTAELDETVTDAQCNHCHGVVQAHGTRRGVQLCLTCHSPQTTDPETGRTVDFKVMIHKIHMGSDLPSVQQKRDPTPEDATDPIPLGSPPATPYYIVGNSQSIHDYSYVAFPSHDGVQHCTTCHSGQDRDNWRQKPTAATCTSCHDNVRFEGSGIPGCGSIGGTGQPPGWTTCLHSGGPIALADAAARNSPAQCTNCHGQGATAAVDRYHHGD